MLVGVAVEVVMVAARLVAVLWGELVGEREGEGEGRLRLRPWFSPCPCPLFIRTSWLSAVAHIVTTASVS